MWFSGRKMGGLLPYSDSLQISIEFAASARACLSRTATRVTVRFRKSGFLHNFAHAVIAMS
jgi:hypothetical protein